MVFGVYFPLRHQLSRPICNLCLVGNGKTMKCLFFNTIELHTGCKQERTVAQQMPKIVRCCVKHKTEQKEINRKYDKI